LRPIASSQGPYTRTIDPEVAFLFKTLGLKAMVRSAESGLVIAGHIWHSWLVNCTSSSFYIWYMQYTSPYTLILCNTTWIHKTLLPQYKTNLQWTS